MLTVSKIAEKYSLILVAQDMWSNCAQKRFLFRDARTKCPPLIFLRPLLMQPSFTELNITHTLLSTANKPLRMWWRSQQWKSIHTPPKSTWWRWQTSMDMMEKATQRLQTGLGMRMKLTTIMKADVTNTDWIDWKKMWRVFTKRHWIDFLVPKNTCGIISKYWSM